MPKRHFARFRLTATKTQPLALNAIVRVTAGGVTQQDHVRLAEGFMSQLPLDVHFGLGDATTIDKVEIVWPSKDRQVLTNLPADRLFEVREGSEPKPSELKSWPAETRPRAKASFSFDMALPRLEGGEAPAAAKGKPAVLNFWAPWCEPCKEELPQLARLAVKYGADVQFAGISVETAKLDDVKSSAKAFGLTYPQFLSNEPILKSFFEDGKAILPSTFVFDRAGRLRRVFHRALTEPELAGLLESFREESVTAAECEIRGHNFMEMKRPSDALEYFRKAVEVDPSRASSFQHMGSALVALKRNQEAILAYERALAIEPSLGLAHWGLGLTLHAEERFAEAVPHYQKSIEILGGDYDRWYSLGLAAGASRLYPASLDAFERSLKFDAKGKEAWIGKANVHRTLGQMDEARKCISTALEAHPKDQELQQLLQSLGK